jgi:hypothetical protein
VNRLNFEFVAAPATAVTEPPQVKSAAYNSIMSLKNAALVALIGMTLLTFLMAVVFIRDVSAFAAGAIAAIAFLVSLIHVLASLGLAVFLYVFYKAQAR